MTFALTYVKAYGIEASEPLQKRFKQCLELKGTAANTDVAYDFGTYAGTFWTAVGSTEPGLTALNAIKGIQTIAKIFLSAQGTGLNGYLQTDASVAVVQALTSAAYGGGSATPTLTVTGLKTTDTILGAQQVAKNSNNLPLIGSNATCAVNDQYPVIYSADPGTTGTVKVIFSRAATNAVQTGTFQLSMDATNTLLPDILFLSGNAPTAFDIMLTWELQDQVVPIEVTKSA